MKFFILSLYHRTGKQSETQKEKKTYYHRRTYQNSNVQSNSFPLSSAHFRAFFRALFRASLLSTDKTYEITTTRIIENFRA